MQPDGFSVPHTVKKILFYRPENFLIDEVIAFTMGQAVAPPLYWKRCHFRFSLLGVLLDEDSLVGQGGSPGSGEIAHLTLFTIDSLRFAVHFSCSVIGFPEAETTFLAIPCSLFLVLVIQAKKKKGK